jgi:hypothetical protein
MTGEESLRWQLLIVQALRTFYPTLRNGLFHSSPMCGYLRKHLARMEKKLKRELAPPGP